MSDLYEISQHKVESSMMVERKSSILMEVESDGVAIASEKKLL